MKKKTKTFNQFKLLDVSDIIIFYFFFILILFFFNLLPFLIVFLFFFTRFILYFFLVPLDLENIVWESGKDLDILSISFFLPSSSISLSKRLTVSLIISISFLVILEEDFF